MIFTYYPNDFWHKLKMYNFDPFNVLLDIATIYPSDLRLLLCSRVTYKKYYLAIFFFWKLHSKSTCLSNLRGHTTGGLMIYRPD